MSDSSELDDEFDEDFGKVAQKYPLICPICGGEFRSYLRGYPNRVCGDCNARAVNSVGVRPMHNCSYDVGDNPVFIDGIQCWRYYKFGGYITMRDPYHCETPREYFERSGMLRRRLAPE